MAHQRSPAEEISARPGAPAQAPQLWAARREVTGGSSRTDTSVAEVGHQDGDAISRRLRDHRCRQVGWHANNQRAITVTYLRRATPQRPGCPQGAPELRIWGVPSYRANSHFFPARVAISRFCSGKADASRQQEWDGP